ncbi:MAG: arylsulfatase [Flavobacteriaceae bacterium]|nr:arylsulfatase [Flavobacteriaceae bacterium]
MNTIYFLLFVILLTSCNVKQKEEEVTSSESLPNIVYILADDMGYGDLSSLNAQSGIQTPNMDRIVSEGIYFTDAHSNSSVCTPTRYGILTGRYAWRSHLKEGVLWGYDQPLIEEDRVTVASYLKDNGYNTACIGKWHLGLGWQPKDSLKPISKYEWGKVFKEGDDSNVDFNKPVNGPNELGFDYSYIIPASLDMTPYLYLENGKAVELPTAYTEGKSEDKDGRGVFWRSGEVAKNFVFNKVLNNLTKKTVSYIEKQKQTDEPFFIYFALTAPHTPWLPTEDAIGKSKVGRYGDFVTNVDDAVGAVVDALEKTGKIDNTLIIVTSDNGSHWTLDDKELYSHRANYVFKGQKADIYEGGHHIPFIAKWTGNIKAGSSSNQIMSTTDLLATVSGIINKPLPQAAGEDSYNMLPAFLGTHKRNNIRDFIIHHSLFGFFSIRKGKWKLTDSLGSGGFSRPVRVLPKESEAQGTLYDMESDIGETNNLYNQNPKVVAELLSILNKCKE